MPEIPDDLIRLTEVLKTRRPSRTWWDKQIADGVITAYKIPGDRGLYLSKAAVEQLLQPHPYIKGEDSDAG